MAEKIALPAFDPETAEREERQPYPPPSDKALSGKTRQVLGDPLGLTQFGVNLTRLAPGAVSALRHWHSGEDEFVYIVSGNPTLVTDAGEQILGPGLVAGFPAGEPDGHLLANRTDAEVSFIEVGTRAAIEDVHYPESDLVLKKEYHAPNRRFTRHDGTPV
jgi:uncharacterized cupin superfamily protein